MNTTVRTLPELLTPAEVAAELGAEVDDVLAAVDAGRISALRLGPDVRIPRRELTAGHALEA